MKEHHIRYASRNLSTRLGRPLTDLPETLLERVFHALSRSEEVENPIRDQWGNWDWQYCKRQRSGDLYKPWLDIEVNQWAEAQAGRTEARKTPWPEGRPFALCLTHDVDFVTLHSWRPAWRRMHRPDTGLRNRAAAARAVAGSAVRQLRRAMGSGTDPLWHYEDWLDLESKHGMKSTFFFFPTELKMPHLYDCSYSFSDAVRFKGKKQTVAGMMKEIARNGWEVGLHGSYHSATEMGVLAGEKKQIETALGQPIASTRQHWLHYDVRVTPQCQEAAGLLADSTHGFNRSIGFRAGTAFPYWTWDCKGDKPTSVLQIPQHVMDGALFSANALEYDEAMAVQHGLELMDAVQEAGGCYTLSWHPNYLNDPKWWNVYKALLEEAHRRKAWNCTVKELYDLWVAREQQIGNVRGS